MNSRKRSAGERFSTLAILAVVIWSFASIALAAPTTPILTLGELEAKIAATDTPIPGYLKTVLRGSTIATIPVKVHSVTGTGDLYSSLIMFEATGPQIISIGGIAAGMSGSPIYVDDGGTDKMIGALSYGDWFTLSGTGLATPIEFMSRIESAYAPASLSLPAPVITSGGAYDRIVIGADPDEALRESRAGSFVARPLASMYVGGLRSGSQTYQRLSKILDARGINVIPMNTRAGGVKLVGGVPFSTELTSGASVGAFTLRGDLQLGEVGTVTYRNGTKVLAFGHPSSWWGATGQYLTNAWIDGIWPTSMEPYKMGVMGVVRGTVTQDRWAGIMGVAGIPPLETAITASTTNRDTGETTSSACYMPRKLLSSSLYYLSYSVLPAAVSVANANLFDTYYVPGSALTTTTLVVVSGANTYTVRMTNMVEDADDIVYAVTNDLAMAFFSLGTVWDEGSTPLTITSVDVQSEVFSARKLARAVDIRMPAKLKAGPNRIYVQARVFGKNTTQSVAATLTLPAGTPSEGSIDVEPAAYGSDYWDECGDESAGYDAAPTAASVVRELNATPRNNQLTVTFTPQAAEEDYSAYSTTPSPKPIEMTIDTPWVIGGMVSKNVTSLNAAPVVTTCDYAATGKIRGTLAGAEDGGLLLRVYGTPAGQPERLLTTVRTDDDGDYTASVGSMSRNMVVRVAFDGNADHTNCQAWTHLHVRPKVTTSASGYSVSKSAAVVLTARSTPASTAGCTVTFQYRSLGTSTWKTASTRTLRAPSGGTYASATMTIRPAVSVEIRSRTTAGATNTAGTSPSIKIYVH